MKKLDDYLPSFDSCRLSEPPFCRAVCPFHLDVAGFVGKVWAGAYSAAYRIYRDAVCFPRVVSEICPAPCRDACPLGQVRQEGAQAGAEPGGAVDLPLLERRAVDEAGGTPPNDYNIPVRGGRVAVVGAGLSGLGCALRLATRKYRVEIFEKTDRIGGADLAGMEQGVREACLRDIKAQFGNEDYELHLGHEVASIDDLTGQGFDAVYIATGSGGADFGFARGGSTEPAAAPGVGKCVVCGGALVGDGGVYALAAGLNMAVAIDGWFKTGKLSIAEDEYKTCAELHPMTMALAARRAAAQQAAGRKPARRTPGRRGAGSGGAGGMEEGGALGHSEPARLEAARCIECKCNACELFCDLIGYTGKQPPRIREEVFATTLPGASEVKHLPAKRLMHLCTQCGVCKEVCPESIDIGGLILAGRQQMHRYGKAPWAFHEFFLRDMEHADSEAAGFALMPGGNGGEAEGIGMMPCGEARYAFFPGCQLGAGDPRLLLRTYEAIKNADPSVGIFVKCCGAPAEWAGEDERHAEKLASLRDEWRELGEPSLLMACPTCAREFREHMPEIPVSSVYEWLDEKRAVGKLSFTADAGAEPVRKEPTLAEPVGAGLWAVFDPCSSRGGEGVQAAVRSLASAAGMLIEELLVQSRVERCCGYGGQPSIADPGFAEHVAADRAGESGLPYITYCINCRDAFAQAGKEAKHVFEILFPAEEAPAPAENADTPPRLPTATERRRNREYLKRALAGGSFDNRECGLPQPARQPGNGLRVGARNDEIRGARNDEIIETRNDEIIETRNDEIIKTRNDEIIETRNDEILEACNDEIIEACNGGVISCSDADGLGARYGFTLIIPERLLRKMDEQKILADDVYEVVEFMRRTGRSAQNPQAGTHSGYRKIGHMTYWAEYRERSAGELELVNVYAHRMSIDMERIWNGHRTRDEFLSE